MARVTVEDCALIVENRFELVAIAAKRTKDIYSGSPITVDRDNDKNPVVALREIAERKVDADSLREHIIKSNQRKLKTDMIESEEDFVNSSLYEDAEINEEIEAFGTEDDLFDEEAGYLGDDSLDSDEE